MLAAAAAAAAEKVFLENGRESGPLSNTFVRLTAPTAGKQRTRLFQARAVEAKRKIAPFRGQSSARERSSGTKGPRMHDNRH